MNHYFKKKSTAIAILLLAAAIAFAQEEPVQPEKKDKRFAVDVGLGYHYELQDMNAFHYEDQKNTISSININFSGNYFFSKYIGIGLFGNFIIPLKVVNIQQNRDFNNIIHSDKTDEYLFLFIMDMLIGPVFNIYKNEKVSFPISIGFHWSYWSWTIKEIKNLLGVVKQNFIGIGANIAGKYNINNLISVYARLQFNYEFLQISRSNESIPLKFWNISPSLGISFRF